MAQNYPRLSIEEFGSILLETGDLDPIYIALHGMDMDEDKLGRWLIAYWCFYSAGVACWMSERGNSDFWDHMHVAAANRLPAPHGGRWERGAERRHFRGAQGTAAVAALASQYPTRPADMLDMLTAKEHGCETLTFAKVSSRAKSHRGFGDWMAFKVVDMIDRVLGIPVTFEKNDVMYETPTQGAIMVADTTCPTDVSVGAKVDYAIGRLSHAFGKIYAPPLEDRPVGLQEFETILCKWKSHMGGHYPIGKDLHEITEGLGPWLPHCATASNFLGHMPGAEYANQTRT